jgi:2-methylcitrate dehydratase PrpD
VTATDEILALAASAGMAATVTEADVAAFRALAAAGEDGAAARALLAARPATGSLGQPAGHPDAPSAPVSGSPAWTAWLMAAAAASGSAVTGAAAMAGEADAGERTAGTPAWCAVFGAAVAITDPPGSAPPAVAVTAAVTAGLGAAAIVESGLTEWGGWSSGTVAAVVGAGVTAGLLLGLTGPRLRAAIGICATQAAGLRAVEGTDAFPLQAGKAAFNGVEAALLARAGFTAPAEPLDGRRGLFALFGS